MKEDKPARSTATVAPAVLKRLGLTIPKDFDPDGHWCAVCNKPLPSPADLYQARDYRCPECESRRASQLAKRCAEQAARQRDRLLSAVPLAMRDTNPELLPNRAAYDLAMAWTYGPTGLCLYGPTRSGKTRIAWQIAIREALDGRGVATLTPFELLSYCAQLAQSTETALLRLDAYLRVDLLVLDDVFKSKLTERVEELLFILVDQRAAWQKPCIVTLNDTGDSLRKRLSLDRGPALVGRLREHCKAIKVGP